MCLTQRFAYAGQLALVGANSICVPVYEENDFRLQTTDIEKAITPSTRALLLSHPTIHWVLFWKKRILKQLQR